MGWASLFQSLKSPQRLARCALTAGSTSKVTSTLPPPAPRLIILSPYPHRHGLKMRAFVPVSSSPFNSAHDERERLLVVGDRCLTGYGVDARRHRGGWSGRRAQQIGRAHG